VTSFHDFEGTGQGKAVEQPILISEHMVSDILDFQWRLLDTTVISSYHHIVVS